MANETSNKPSFSPGRKWSIGFNIVVASLAVLALVVMANYLGVRHYWRFQLSERGQAKLSPQTLHVLHSLTNQVKVTIFFDAQEEEEVYSLVSSLLKEYNYLNPEVVIDTVDPTRNPGKAELVLAQNKLTNLKDKNFILFESSGHTRVVYQNQLSDYDLQQVFSGRSQEVRRNGFRGEMLFTTAIFNVANPRPYQAYFLQGHGEHDPELAGDPRGYAKFAALLKDQNYIDWQKFTLQGTNEVPMDCQLLIIAGPQIPFTEVELARIEGYLKQGGRLFALLNNMARGKKSGLEKVLAKWGVGVADDIVFDAKFADPTSGYDLYTANLNLEHPVVKYLVPEGLRIRLVMPRAIGQLRSIAPNADAPKVDLLAATSNEGTEATDIREGIPYRSNLPNQVRTNFPLMVAVEQGTIKDVTTDRGTTRLVVVGDSLCLDNLLIDLVPANLYFAAQAANWLLDRPQVLLDGLGPRPVQEYKLLMTQSQQQSVKWLLLAALPGSVLLLGGLVWLRRRR